MPLINRSNQFKPPFIQFNGHLQTLIPSLLREPPAVPYVRERFTLSDGDFIDLDWVQRNSKKLIVITHGLEGSSGRPYITGTANAFMAKGYDILAWNCRSCSGEMNKALRMYHHGDIADISEMIDYAIEKHNYEEVNLIGYSMGGNITLKYMGVNGDNLPKAVKKGMSISAPVDLKAGIVVIEQWQNFLYNKKFHRSLREKVKEKAKLYPDQIDASKIDDIKTWYDFDLNYTCPMHGFANPEEFYYEASSINFAEGLRRPLLLLQAQNDPILSPECFPKEIASKHEFLHLEVTKHGGHVGFATNKKGIHYSEQRAIEWICNE